MRKQLPTAGTDWNELREQMLTRRKNDVRWRDGRAAVYVFHAGEDVLEVAHEAYGLFISENGLGPGAFPSLKRMESEVIEMALSLQSAPANGAGSMTAGGTESIMLAVKACRDYTQAQQPVAGTPKIIAPYSVHPAFDKAAHLFGLELVRVPLGNGFAADVARMAAEIDARTVMLVGSAPCFPYGVIDPMAELSALALQHNIWLHVDACVGGYLSPFMRKVQREQGRDGFPACDFSLAGVQSMSLDLHKYGYAAKGASTVLYRDKSLRDAQVFKFDDWPCGSMYTPTFAGTRPGGAIAAAWAVLHYLGEAGYCERAARIDRTRERLAEFCREQGLEVFGDPRLSIIAFGDRALNMLGVGEGLYQDGWFSSRVQNPDGIQYMISPEHERFIEEYLEVLKGWLDRARRGELGHRGGPARYA